MKVVSVSPSLKGPRTDVFFSISAGDTFDGMLGKATRSRQRRPNSEQEIDYG